MRPTVSLLALALLGAAPGAVHAQPLECATCCCRCADEATLDAEEHEAKRTLGVAAALFVPAWVAGTTYAWLQPGGNRFVESTPIAGAIVAATRADRANMAALLFSAGVQTMGVLLAVVAASELEAVDAQRHSLGLSIAASPDGVAMAARLRW